MTDTNKIRLYFFGRYKLLLESWALFVNKNNFEVVGISTDIKTVEKAAESLQGLLFIIDISSFPLGSRLASKLIGKFPRNHPCIFITDLLSAWYLRQINKAGVKAILCLDAGLEEIQEAIMAVSKGKKYLCNHTKEMLAQEFVNEEKGNAISLSLTEISIALLICKGLSSKEIAIVKSISLKTAESHRYNILKKLRLNNTAALINYLHKNGLSVTGHLEAST